MFFNEILLIYTDDLFYANEILAGIVHEFSELQKADDPGGITVPAQLVAQRKSL